jgi:uncharacterized protein YaaR (DUF327 family)
MPGMDPLGVSPFLSTAGNNQIKKSDKKDSKDIKKTGFSRYLENTNLEEGEVSFENDISLPPELRKKSIDDILQYLVDSVYSSGDTLKNNPTMEDFKDYRNKLSQFMTFVVKHSYTVETTQRRKTRRNMNPAPHVMIETINAKLDELAAGILFNQTEQIKILAKIDEINGLVVNLLS